MRFHRLAAPVAALAMFAGLTGTAMANDTGPQCARLNIAYSGLMLLAEKQNLSPVVCVSVPAGPQVVDALLNLSGVTFGGIATVPVLKMTAVGADPRIVATMFTNPEAVGMVTLDDSPAFRDPCALKGASIGYTAETNGHIYLTNLLAACKLTLSDVIPVEGKPAALVSALVTGKVSTVLLWDPYIQQAERLARANGRVVETHYRRDLHLLAFHIVTTEAKLVNNKEAIKDYLRALIQAENYINGKDRAKAQATLENMLGLEPGDLGHFMGNTTFRVELNVPLLTDALAAERKWYGTVRPSTDPRTDMSQFVDASLLEAVDASRVKK